MLRKKMLRDIRGNFAQFFSIFLLSMVAMWCFTGFEANVIGGGRARERFHEKTNCADGWIYGSSFTEEQRQSLAAVDKINDVQLRTEVLGKADEKYNTAEVYCYFEEENTVTKPYVVEGAEFDPSDTEGVWMFYRFADAWDFKLGDSFTVHVLGQDITKQIRGFVATPEYEYACASTDADTDFHNISFLYFSMNVLPEELRSYNQLLFTCEGKALSLEDDISKALDNKYAFIADRDSIPGYYKLSDELAQHESFAYVFAFVFVAIALLVIMTTMKRMISQQRTQIGTMNALGLKKRKILLHYLSFSLVVSLLGGIAGVGLGLATLGRMMVEMFGGQYYSVPEWSAGFDYRSIVLVCVIVGVCVLTAFFSCRQVLKIQPSEALRPAAAPDARPCVFEKLPFWDKLSFNARYNLRDICRSKLRAFMGVFGTAVGMLLMTMGLGCFDSLDYVRDWYFDKIQNYDYQVQFADNATFEQKEAIKAEYGGEYLATYMISMATDDHPTSEDILSCKLVSVEGEGLFGLTDMELDRCKLEPGTVGVTKNQAARLGIKKGDRIFWKLSTGEQWVEAKVGCIIRHPSIMGIYILREDAEKVEGLEYSPAMLLSNDKRLEDIEDSAIASVHSREELVKAFDKSMEIMDLLVWFMSIFSVMMIVIVLYNSGNLSFNEREKEFATLKVLGFGSRRIRRLMATQNLWLSLIGTLAGMPFGKQLIQLMMDTNGDSIDWPCYISARTVVLSALLVMGVSVLVSFMFAKRIRRIDMVEVLKGME